jgi:putative membrane protein
MATARLSRREGRWLILLVLLASAFSGIGPEDRFTWVLEITPVFIGLPLLLVTRRIFPLTPLLYRLLVIHALILILGAHYTYAGTPLGFWAQDLFGFERNHYDRLGHFAQGFIPAILAREILLRRSPLKSGAWLFFIVVCICLAFSAFYELIEWWTAAVSGDAAREFLGTQGDPWDTQWDMFLAMVGAMTSLLLLRRMHDRQLERMGFSGFGRISWHRS